MLATRRRRKNGCGMEKLRGAVNEIAYASSSDSKLSPLQRSLLPFLSLASSLYGLALALRRSLYQNRIFQIHRLPVPVVSVGNLTWGGNGKTPMVEFIARWLAHSGISPLILSRGYGNGDEVNMLQRHLLGTPTKFGVGANRAAVAGNFIQKYGYIDTRESSWYEKQQLDQKSYDSVDSEKVGVVVLDDAMQHWSLWRDLDIVMVNGLTLWGNLRLLPVGPLREPLTALRRADVVVIHHADLMGALYVDRVDFSDHHMFHGMDIELITARLGELEGRFGSKPIVVVTEKDYDRDPEILKQLYPFKVFVLCSSLKVVPYRGSTEDSFKKFLRDQLKLELPAANQS